MATEKKAVLRLLLEDGATAALNAIEGTIQKFRSAWLETTAAVAGAVIAIRSALNAYAEEESAVNRLNGALRSQNIYTREYSDKLVEMARDIQRTTTVSKEAALGSMTLLTSFGLAGKQMEAANKAAIDLSAGLGIDLRTATILISKAWEGQTQTLSRYGIIINQSADHATKFAEVLSKIQDKFGGRAAAEVGTYAGHVEQLKNRFNDLEQEMGKQLIPTAELFLDWIGKSISKIEELNKVDGGASSGRRLTIKTMSEQIALIQQNIGNSKALGLDYSDQQKRLEKLTAAREREVSLLKQERKARPAVNEPQSKVDPEVLFNEQIKRMELAKKKAAAKGTGPFGLIEDKQAIAKQEIDLEEKKNEKIYGKDQALALQQLQLQKLRRDNFKSTLDFISSLSSAKNEELAAIGKAASSAQAVIKTYEAANVALASAPPPFNFALAAAVTAAGLANVATIAGVQLAEGGMVLPRAGGVPATIGEAGKRELVVPLNDPKTKKAMADSGMGGNHYHFHVGTLVADQMGIEAFARKLDEALFRMKRNRQTVAF